jgi:acyl carrier protein
MTASEDDGLDIQHKVIGVVADYFSVCHRTVGISSRLVEDLYLDSMGVVELVMALNDAFAIELPESGVAEWKTVGDICRTIEEGNRSP